MAKLEEQHADNPEVVDLCLTVGALVGSRTVMGMVLDCATGDRVHPDVFPLQATGRFSVTNPGLTVLGKHGGKVAEREVFLPDADDHVLLGLDLSKADARAVAVWSQDQLYLDWFEAGVDINQQLADQFNISKAKAKALGHGTRYNQQAKGMHRQNPTIPLKDCEAFLERHRRNHRGVHRWLDAVVARAESGRPLRNGFGRDLDTARHGKNHPLAGESKAFTQAPAWIGQTTTREWMVEGVLNLRPEVAKCIRAFLHDEIVLSIPVRHLDLYREDLQRCFNFWWAPPVEDLLVNCPGEPRSVQVVAEFSAVGRNWAECYTGE
jgi:DNA polymerase-1